MAAHPPKPVEMPGTLADRHALEYRPLTGACEDLEVPSFDSIVRLEVDWRFRAALVPAHETGHRIGAIHQLRWSVSQVRHAIHTPIRD